MTRILITIGIILILIGLLWPLIHKSGLGHLPGDILIKRKNFAFYFPFMTTIIISIIATIIFWLINKFFH
jgi:ABC-type phosphate transport system permease subunit